jgi:hypothetical protein
MPKEVFYSFILIHCKKLIKKRLKGNATTPAILAAKNIELSKFRLTTIYFLKEKSEARPTN